MRLRRIQNYCMEGGIGNAVIGAIAVKVQFVRIADLGRKNIGPTGVGTKQTRHRHSKRVRSWRYCRHSPGEPKPAVVDPLQTFRCSSVNGSNEPNWREARKRLVTGCGSFLVMSNLD